MILDLDVDTLRRQEFARLNDSQSILNKEVKDVIKTGLNVIPALKGIFNFISHTFKHNVTELEPYRDSSDPFSTSIYYREFTQIIPQIIDYQSGYTMPVVPQIFGDHVLKPLEVYFNEHISKPAQAIFIDHLSKPLIPIFNELGLFRSLITPVLEPTKFSIVEVLDHILSTDFNIPLPIIQKFMEMGVHVDD